MIKFSVIAISTGKLACMNVEEQRQRHALIDEEPMLEKESACKSLSANISQRGLHVPCFSNEEPSPSCMPSNT
jgi:hypothetical protein